MDIVALLDKPSSNSFGVVPFVVRVSEDTFRVVCLGMSPRPDITRGHLSQLINSGGAHDISACGAKIDVINHSFAAGWLGKRFEEKIAEVQAPIHTAPTERYILDNQGSFWVAEYNSIYSCLVNYVEICAKRVFREKNKDIADLMGWTLPDKAETQAAIWWTLETKEKKDNYLKWVVRTDRKKTTTKNLVKEYTRIVEHYTK